jgi:hypothetical protein
MWHWARNRRRQPNNNSNSSSGCSSSSFNHTTNHTNNTNSSNHNHNTNNNGRRRRDVSFWQWRAVAACMVVQISVVIFGVFSLLAKGTTVMTTSANMPPGHDPDWLHHHPNHHDNHHKNNNHQQQYQQQHQQDAPQQAQNQGDPSQQIMESRTTTTPSVIPTNTTSFLPNLSEQTVLLSTNSEAGAVTMRGVGMAAAQDHSNDTITTSSTTSTTTSTSPMLAEFDRIHDQLFGPPRYGDGHCPPDCGCVETPYDCPRWYDIEHIVQASAMPRDHTATGTTNTTTTAADGADGAANANTNDIDRSNDDKDNDNQVLLSELQKRFQQRNFAAQQECHDNQGSGVLRKGGWCLSDEDSKEMVVVYHDSTAIDRIPVPKDHVPESKMMLQTLKRMIKDEGIQSINDFGAGVGQYKAGILRNIPNMTYRAYDGAGNIEAYTKGFVSFFDLSMPLSSAQERLGIIVGCGKHVPSRYEGWSSVICIDIIARASYSCGVFLG